MTNPAPANRSLKRVLLFSALAAIVLAVTMITYFLQSFDLNAYRGQAEERLSTVLQLPVKIGGIHFNLHDTNLALHIIDLRIGNEDSTLRADIPETLIDLQWWGLLSRDIHLTRISLIEPRIVKKSVSKRQDGENKLSGEPAIAEFNHDLPQSINIARLEIFDGTIQIESFHSDNPAGQINITELNGDLADLNLGHEAQFTMTGSLTAPGQTENSQWQLQGLSSLKMNGSNGLEPQFNLDLDAKKLDLQALSSFFVEDSVHLSVDGTSDLHLHLEGTPSEGIDFQAGLLSDQISISPGPSYNTPVLFKGLLVSGRLQTSGEQPGIKGLSLQFDESRLAGSISWNPRGRPFSTTFTILNSTLTVSQLKGWLPDDRQMWQSIRKRLQDQGSILIDLADFTLAENALSRKELRLDQLKGEFQKVAWGNGKTPAIEIISLPFDYANNLWQINQGRGQWGSLQLTVDGEGKYDQDGIKLMSVDFAAEAQTEALLDEWQIPRQSFSPEGHVAVRGHFEGPLDQLTLDLQADLSQLSVNHPDGLSLKPAVGDKLTLQGTLSPQKLSLDHGTLKWSIANGSVSGAFLMEDPDSLAIDALLSIGDMSKLAGVWPLLETLQLHGQADLSIRQEGWPEQHRPDVVLTLRDAGLHATRFIADLSQINGRVRLTPTGLSADKLNVHLGQSPLTLQARLESFANPQLFLDVKAPAIHADDLVFYSGKALLRDINGHLEIDRDGLLFDQVDVRLDGGTRASVRGTISFHAPYDVQLDITSEFARIGEVINLWTDRSEASEKRSSTDRDKASSSASINAIRINARVKNGDLYGMKFHDASGLIVPSHEHLSIHPLDFYVGEGFCNAQVLTDFSAEKPTILRVSGHAQDVDALEVYRELLNQKNIVRGKLRGDFYLSGEIGANYLPTSYGNFSIQIHDGVLHQFQFLSKIFSLLNVSQIFAFELPDMDTEGMPFDTLTANLQLEKGILMSEDLKIQSEAMNQSYIGQLNLIDHEVDLAVAIHPLGTVDKVVSHIPVAGWLLTGEDKALLTAHFTVTGKTNDVSVNVTPLDTLYEPTIGLLKRTLGLPFKLIEEPQILWGGEGGKE